MALHSDIPFKLLFINPFTTQEVTQFVSDESELNLIEPIKIKENIPLKLQFISDKSCFLYLGGFEHLLADLGGKDEANTPCLLPSPSERTLFDTEEPSYPLIPAFFVIKVVVDNVPYYSLYNVIPTRLTVTEWEIMRNELEMELRGLAQDFIRKNININPATDSSVPLPPKYLFHFLIIQRHFPKVMSALADISEKPFFTIQKEYQIVPKVKAKSIDEQSIKFMLTKRELQDKAKIPQKRINYDLPQNRWLKKIIRHLNTCINDFVEAVILYSEEINKEIAELEKFKKGNNSKIILEKRKVLLELESYKQDSLKIQNAIKIIKIAPWYNEVGDVINEPSPLALVCDSRFRILYRLYRELHFQDFEIILDNQYSFQWKRTDKLYEIWSFLKIHKVLIKLGFKSFKGWLNDVSIDNRKVLIPSLPSGTTIKLRNQDISLNLVYDAYLPRESANTNRYDQPLYISGSSNRPDCRIDIYKSNIYAGSILIDFKYRNPDAIWDINKARIGAYDDPMNQLISYANHCASLFLYGDNDIYTAIFRPVGEVWAIYPKSYNNKSLTFYPDHRLKLIRLCPGLEEPLLEEQLNDAIASAIKRWEKFSLRPY